MNVFILGSPLETARQLDKKRLNNQINECTIILRALRGESKAWANHPCTLQYRGYEQYLRYYRRVLEDYKEEPRCAILKYKDNPKFSFYPNFHTPEFINQMKRRLYTKDPEHYKQFAHLGESNQNWFWVDGVMRVYENGKRII